MQLNPKFVAKNKLSILFILSCADFDIREDQLIEYVSDTKLMEYFDLMKSLSELKENSLINIIPSGTAMASSISLTDIGKTTLEAFIKELSFTWRESTEEYFDKNRERLLLESKLFADYLRIGENQYRLTLRIVERNLPVFEIMMICTSKEEADSFAKGWKKNAMQVYLDTTTSILKNQTL